MKTGFFATGRGVADPAILTRAPQVGVLRAAAHMVFVLSLCVGLWLGVLGSAVSAQSNGASVPDYTAWNAVAQRAELAVENGRASTSAMEALRVQIADWRDIFLNAQKVNAPRIKTLREQLAVLGKAPKDGDEPADITKRRANLTAQLAEARAPVVTAEEAYSRADGVIGEIDSIIRSRQANELFTGGPSPLNPVNWGPAFNDLFASWSGVVTEVKSAYGSKAQRRTLANDLPIIILVLIFGLTLFLRGRRWAVLLTDVLRRTIRRGARAWKFVASLFKIILPYIGLIGIVAAIFGTGMIGLRGTLVLDNVPLYGLFFLIMWWLGEHLFAANDDFGILPLDPSVRGTARLDMALMAALVIVTHAVNVLAVYDTYSDATRAVIGFPLLVATGFVLLRFGRTLRASLISPDTEEESGRYRIRMANLVARAAIVVAIAGPIAAALGYGTAAARVMFSSIFTMALLGGVLVLQSFVKSLFDAITGRDETRDESLIPVLIGFVLALLAIPILALIWGARVADLTEAWATFQEGFSLGDSKISPMDFVTFVIVFTIGYMATRLLQGAMRSTILPRTKLDAGGRNAIVSGIGYVGIFLAALVAISSAGIDLSSVAIVAGALSVGIGFGLQNIVSNFVSGIILLIERPIAEGDWIEVGGKMGYVRGISVRSTRIETFDRTDVIVPNADLVSGMVTNWTRGKTVGRVIVPVGVAYGNDTRKVEDILMAIAREHPMVLLNPAPAVIFQGFGADSLDFEIRAILRDVNYLLTVKSDINHAIARRFGEEGIEIPFAQRDIYIKNPEALVPVPAQAQPVPQGDAAAADPDGDADPDAAPQSPKGDHQS